ncbi:hypothetical protein F4774DRAFT_412971 [Daldinia eschscholtzii]|nr:hypothetical protein F4774DRAFT_412971 [Daldinia eschscholtzii]
MATPPLLTPEQIAQIDEDEGPVVVAVSAFFIAISTATIVLRFLARLARRMKLGLDDWLSFGGLIFVVLYCTTCIISVPYGMGRHIWAADRTQAWKIIQVGLYNAFVYIFVHWFIKMSILAFYTRVFTLNVRWFKSAVYIIILYTTGWAIGAFFATLFQCSPPALFWEQYNPALNPRPKGSCHVHNASLVISSSALNTAGDIMVFALPIAILFRLQLKRTQKVGLVLLFATGALAIIAGIIRLKSSLSAVALNADVTWVTANIYLWTAVETAVGLLCGSLPVIGPLFGLVKDKVASYVSNSSLGTLSIAGKSFRWSPVSSGLPGSATEPGGSKPTTNHELQPSAGQGILRTDEYWLDSYPRAEENSLENDRISARRTKLENPV